VAKCYDDATCTSAEWRFTPVVPEHDDPNDDDEKIPEVAETKTCRLWTMGGLLGTGTAATGGSINETYHKKTDTTAAVFETLYKFDMKSGLATNIALWRADGALWTEDTTLTKN